MVTDELVYQQQPAPPIATVPQAVPATPGPVVARSTIAARGEQLVVRHRREPRSSRNGFVLNGLLALYAVAAVVAAAILALWTPAYLVGLMVAE